MGNRVRFRMDPGYRDQLVEKHVFYVQQAKKRLLEQFTDAAISQEADGVADASWDRRGQNFNPDYDDPADGAEDAYHDGVWRYQLLMELRDNVRLNIVSGFFHTWEKTLREWMVLQVQSWHRGETVRDKLWRSPIPDLFDLLEGFGWPLRAAPFFPALDACRLIVNVHKHGDGPALKDLAAQYPRYLVHPLSTLQNQLSKPWFKPKHDHLKIDNVDLDAFADAITAFWSQVPLEMFDPTGINPPGWFIKAVKADQNIAGTATP